MLWRKGFMHDWCKQQYFSFLYACHNGSFCQLGFKPNALGSMLGYLIKILLNLSVRWLPGLMMLSKYFMQQRCTYNKWCSIGGGTLASHGCGGFGNNFGRPGRFLFHNRPWCAQILRIWVMLCNQLGKNLWFTVPNSAAMTSFDAIVGKRFPYNFEILPKLATSSVFHAGGRRVSVWYFL